MNSVEELIAKHEGRRNAVYNDSRGIPTVGIGHNIQAHPLPDGWTSPLTDDQVDQLFQQDLAEATTALVQALPWFSNLDPVRQAVVVDMGFNLGVPTLLTFHHTLGFIQGGQWKLAAANMLESLWAKQVGPRATEDAAMMVSGEWPA